MDRMKGVRRRRVGFRIPNGLPPEGVAFSDSAWQWLAEWKGKDVQRWLDGEFTSARIERSIHRIVNVYGKKWKLCGFYNG